MARFMGVHSGLAGDAPPRRRSWLSFPRIVDVPFETCMATLESWQRAGQDGELHIGQSVLRWPIEHDSGLGSSWIEVGLARGPLRPPLRMRLNIYRWSRLSARTALELVPGQRLRPTEAYFRSGHLLLDSLTHLLRQGPSAQRLGGVTPTQPHAHQDAGLVVRPGDEPVTCGVKGL